MTCEEPEGHKIAIFGNGGVGKSAITIQYMHRLFPEQYDPTIEDSYRKALDVDGEKFVLEIMDTAGTEQFTAMRDLYMKNGHGFVLVYSITSQASFDDLVDLYRKIKQVKEQDVPIMLIGNKLDLEDERVVSKAQGSEMAAQFGCRFMETSAKTRENIDQLFQEMVRDINRMFPKPKAQRSGCCFLL